VAATPVIFCSFFLIKMQARATHRARHSIALEKKWLLALSRATLFKGDAVLEPKYICILLLILAI